MLLHSSRKSGKEKPTYPSINFFIIQSYLMIFLQLLQQLECLRSLLLKLTDEQYANKVSHLGNASVGGHTRHVIELLQCAVDGYYEGTVDYVNRNRNLLLEIDRKFSYAALQHLDGLIKVPDKELVLYMERVAEESEVIIVTTSYYREIVYNTEHIIHHLALIKVALIEMNLSFLVSHDFGMANSTIKYQASLNK